MRCIRLIIVVAALLLGSFAFAGGEEDLVMTRVLYLQDMAPKEAMTLLRMEVHVRAIIAFPDRNLVVVTDSKERVNRSEELLRERDEGLVTADPHEPLDLSGIRDLPLVPGSFHIVPDQAGVATDALRALFQVREVGKPDGEGVIAVQAPVIILQAAEAVLAELGLLSGG